MNKFLTTTALVASFSVATIGVSAAVSINGSIDTKFASVQQKDKFRYKDPTITSQDKLLDKNISTDAYLNFKIKSNIDSNLKYGGLIKLNANVSESKKEVFCGVPNNKGSIAEQIMAYLESKYGRVEIGNYTGISESMKVNAGTFANATGGINGDAQYYWNLKTTDNNKNTKDVFLQTTNLPTNELGTFGLKYINAAKINYYTPEILGFHFGATFTPNTKVYGTASQTSVIEGSEGFKNVFETGLSYTGDINNLSFKIAAVGEFGTNQNHRNKDLRAYELGVNLCYYGITIGGSYSDWGKYNIDKGTADEYGNTSYWTAGLSYENGPFAASFTYLEGKKGTSVNSESAHNKLKNAVVGIDYKLAPGVLPYAEFSSFSMNQASQTNNDDNNQGHVFMTGIKLSF